MVDEFWLKRWRKLSGAGRAALRAPGPITNERLCPGSPAGGRDDQERATTVPVPVRRKSMSRSSR